MKIKKIYNNNSTQIKTKIVRQRERESVLPASPINREGEPAKKKGIKKGVEIGNAELKRKIKRNTNEWVKNAGGHFNNDTFLRLSGKTWK